MQPPTPAATRSGVSSSPSLPSSGVLRGAIRSRPPACWWSWDRCSIGYGTGGSNKCGGFRGPVSASTSTREFLFSGGEFKSRLHAFTVRNGLMPASFTVLLRADLPQQSAVAFQPHIFARPEARGAPGVS